MCLTNKFLGSAKTLFNHIEALLFTIIMTFYSSETSISPQRSEGVCKEQDGTLKTTHRQRNKAKQTN